MNFCLKKKILELIGPKNVYIRLKLDIGPVSLNTGIKKEKKLIENCWFYLFFQDGKSDLEGTSY